MDVHAALDAPCPPEDLFAWVEDLGRYPDWLEIVTRARPAAAHPDDQGPAWEVDLRGRLGPLARSKRLRMVRTVHRFPHEVAFERVEHDRRRHAPWVLRASADDTASGTHLTVDLHYGGSLWGPVLERMLGDEIDRSRDRLLALVTS